MGRRSSDPYSPVAKEGTNAGKEYRVHRRLARGFGGVGESRLQTMQRYGLTGSYCTSRLQFPTHLAVSEASNKQRGIHQRRSLRSRRASASLAAPSQLTS